jgi:hypothetical protein
MVEIGWRSLRVAGSIHGTAQLVHYLWPKLGIGCSLVNLIDEGFEIRHDQYCDPGGADENVDKSICLACGKQAYFASSCRSWRLRCAFRPHRSPPEREAGALVARSSNLAPTPEADRRRGRAQDGSVA